VPYSAFIDAVEHGQVRDVSVPPDEPRALG
jgi:hypothetical protein